MASEFTELCEMYGLSPGDPEAIDKLIHFMADPVGDEDTWYFNENAVRKTFTFETYMESIVFINRLAEIA